MKQDIREVLQVLVEEDRTKQASPQVEAALLGAFRANGRRVLNPQPVLNRLVSSVRLGRDKIPARVENPPSKVDDARIGRIATWVGVAAAVAAGVMVVTMLPTPEIAQVSYTPPVPHAPEWKRVEPVAVIAPKVVRRVQQPVAPEPQEVVTDFFPVANVAPPFESGALIRMRVPASTMRSVGFPVSEEHWQDPVSADVLIGQEGIVRAIRFVSLAQ